MSPVTCPISTPGKDGALDGDQRAPGSVSGHTDHQSDAATSAHRTAARTSERRRLVLTVLATVLAAPLLVVEIAPGADAAPESSLAAYHEEIVDEVVDETPDGPARAVGTVTAADLADGRLLSTLTVGEDLRAQAAADALAAEEAQQEAEAEAAAEATTTTTAPPPPPPPPPPPAPEPAPAPSPGGPSAAQWAALRQCESGGNYAAVSPSGRYYGAYQFLPSTWDSTAASVGRHDLVGVRPDHAAPADQDAMALALYNSRGASPWPHCGRHLS